MKRLSTAILALAAVLLLAACPAEPPLTLSQMLEQAPPPPFDPTGWEDGFLAGDLMPENPDPSYLTAPDGLRLAYRDWVPSGWTGTGDMVILIPGSTSHSGHYAVLGKGLSDAGILARVIDVRGLGLSVRRSATSDVNDFSPRTSYVDDSSYYPGRIGDCLDVNQPIRDLNLHAAALEAAHPSARLFLCGHSSGAGIVSRLVEMSGDAHFDGTVLIAPYNHYDQPQNGVSPGGGESGDGEGYSYSILHMGALGAALRGDVHRYVIGFNLGELGDLDLSVVQYTYTLMTACATTDPSSFLQAYSKPLLWIHGAADELFDPTISRQQFDLIPNASGSNLFVTIPDTSHIGLTWSADVASQIATWITNI